MEVGSGEGRELDRHDGSPEREVLVDRSTNASGQASLKRWSRVDYEDYTVREHEIFPIAATITGNVAVVQYHYMMATENYKKERETATGHYTDVLIKENGRWLFLAWEGGDDPKE